MHFIVYMQIFMHKFAILLVFGEKLGDNKKVRSYTLTPNS